MGFFINTCYCLNTNMTTDVSFIDNKLSIIFFTVTQFKLGRYC